MSQQVEQFDRADRWHPEYESFAEWLDAEAPAHECQRLRSVPRPRRARHRAFAPTVCQQCGMPVDVWDIVNHLKRRHPVAT
jgi:hypothetical protein